jgi:hypothetical protein
MKEDNDKKKIFTQHSTFEKRKLSAGFTSKWTKWVVIIGSIYIAYFLAIQFYF